MEYFFDTSSIREMNGYYPTVFAPFWDKMNLAVLDRYILSVDEVLNELETQPIRPHIEEWVEENKHIFRTPTSEESQIVANIFKIPKFQESLAAKKRLKNVAFADPWLIAAANLHQGTVVTQEKERKGGCDIRTICKHFGTRAIDLEEFINEQNWYFS